MNLSTVDRVKLFGSIPGGTAYDGLLAQLLADVSAAAEALMDRPAEAKSYTDVWDVSPGQQIYFLRAWPVTAISTVKYDTAREFGSGTELDSSSYTCDLRTGRLVIDGTTLTGGYGVLQAVYTGGMAADAATFAAAYPDIASVVDAQTVYNFRRRDNLQTSGISLAGGTTNFNPRFDLLPYVERVLKSHRRRIHG